MDDQIQRDVYCTVTKQGDELVQCNDTSISSSFQIWFTFSYKRTFRFQIREQDDENADELQETSNNSLYVEPEEFSDERKTRGLVYDALISWPIDADLCENLTSEVITRTRSIAESMPCGHHLLYIDVDIDVIYYLESQMFNEILQQSIEENNNYMVPTTDSAIKSLERKRLDYENYDCNNCMICLKKFSRRFRVTCMPCSHVFHGKCIEAWLKTSHYCPVCRFEMPTSLPARAIKVRRDLVISTSPETFDARGEL